MTTLPMDPCPAAPKKARGAHNLCVIIPPSAKHPATLFCDRCGATKAVRMTHARPVDDIVREAERIVRAP